jgi:hypothetical protein
LRVNIKKVGEKIKLLRKTTNNNNNNNILFGGTGIASGPQKMIGFKKQYKITAKFSKLEVFETVYIILISICMQLFIVILITTYLFVFCHWMFLVYAAC